MVRISRERRGNISVLTALALPTLLLFCAIGLDLANAYSREAELQKALNAAVLATCRGLAQNDAFTTARTAGKVAAMYNGFNIADGDIIRDPQGNNPNIVKVSSSQPVPLFFLAISGIKSLNVSFVTYGMALGDNCRLLTELPTNKFDSSGTIPIGVMHADLMQFLTCTTGTIKGDATWKNKLRDSFFDSTKSFVPGTTYLLKVGNKFGARIKTICGKGDPANQGTLNYPAPSVGASAYATQLRNAWEGVVTTGETYNTLTGTFIAETQAGVNIRYNAETTAAWVSGTNFTLKTGSLRLVTVPIIRVAGLSAGNDGGTGITNVGYLPYIYTGVKTVEVIGLANFLVSAYSNSYGSQTQDGVITGVFVAYVGTPPSGQNPG